MSHNHNSIILIACLIMAAVCLFIFSTIILHKNPPRVQTDTPPADTPYQPSAPTIDVNKDITPPFIEYPSEIEVYKGDSVSYRKYITARDDRDPDPTLNIDSSAVDLDAFGSYAVTVSATDASGNTSSAVTVVVRVIERPNQMEYDFVNQSAQNILSQIITPEMDDMRKAYAIFNWTRANINWNDFSEKTDYIRGAYDGFSKRQGDCFTYFACSKVLLEAAGIETVDVIKLRESEAVSRHYWSLVKIEGGWYHFDATVFKYNNDLFMLTDEELERWDETYFPGQNIHPYDKTAYPARSTVSVQSRVDYAGKTIIG